MDIAKVENSICPYPNKKIQRGKEKIKKGLKIVKNVKERKFIYIVPETIKFNILQVSKRIIAT